MCFVFLLNHIASWSTNLMAGSPRCLSFGYDSFGNARQTNGVNVPNVNPGSQDANILGRDFTLPLNNYALAFR
jgi:hypothetical protein